MKEREEGINKGGILADDMGLGKTVQTISLIVSNPSKDPACKSTLVVAPLALIRQWESEIKSKTTDGLLSVLVYHGSERISNIETLKTYDVVITTYNVLTGEFQPPAKDERDLDSEFIKPGKDSGPLFKVTWYRVILDEAQTIKNKSTKGAQACCALYSNYRFCLTGTPIQNNLDELYSLFRFLRVKPYCDYATYKREVSDPFKQSRPKTAIKRLQIILKAVMIRRTKFSKLEGKPLLNLPQRKVELKTIPFSLQERRFYDSLEDRMRRKLDAYMQEGSMGTNYTNVLCLLLRLRQACNHPKLVGGQQSAESDIGPTKDDNEEIDDLAAMLGSLDVNVRQCRICQEPLPAGKPKGECDTCSASVLAKQPTQEQLVTSTKIEAMLDILKNTAKTHPGEKTIIFSQFTSMLDLIENALKENGFKYCRYDGQMNNQKREDSLRRIRERPEYTVMLISLKCGSLGLNLTVANRVLMMDIWWNPALEDQAIDRVHRIGQTRDVLVTRLTIVSTVEDRILKLQEKKHRQHQEEQEIERTGAHDAHQWRRMKRGRGPAVKPTFSLFDPGLTTRYVCNTFVFFLPSPC
ncbi:SNF2 family N-terminal domain-containing protein [Polychytrium aggregatum]|uniref:SNF2 family N-terminal domain-containing protein n=1 Tax=Polychytrium aggregatum TaxID=110093 RepID=UPI0022FEE423|nr:SNF2 family N-terminal domain-containing protein [Polychytrium aggregatum]KAI9203791.1 SNF2 family N-terminal domain-containing protein [Polychytrium aggregatum]